MVVCHSICKWLSQVICHQGYFVCYLEVRISVIFEREKIVNIIYLSNGLARNAWFWPWKGEKRENFKLRDKHPVIFP